MLEFIPFDKSNLDKVYDFIINIYTINRKNTIEATLFNYFVNYNEIDASVVVLKNKKITAAIITSIKTHEVYLSLDPELIDEEICEIIDKLKSIMIKYNLELHISSKAQKLKSIIKNKLTLIESWKFYNLDLSNIDNLDNVNIPDGYKIASNVDLNKLADLIHFGFDEVVDKSVDAIKKVIASKYHLDLDVLITDKDDNYVGFCGVWLDKKNSVCHLEPLCVLSEYRYLGIGKAIISLVIKKIKDLKLKYIIGGVSEFYERIGFTSYYRDEVYEIL